MFKREGGGSAVETTASETRRLTEALEELEVAELRRFDRPMRRRAGGIAEIDGRALTDFSSNDYLGIAQDPRPAAAAASALAEEGTGAGAARLISGTHPLHRELEGALADFMGRESTLLFGSGYAANMGAIPALAGSGDLLYSDALNHASLIDGCRLSSATVRIFPHADLGALAQLLEADRGRPGARWIVVEGVYSMDGDLFPLDRLVGLAREHGARIYLDDAHAVGVLGARGRGSAEHLGVAEEVEVVMGTLGKAFGTAGAFVAGSAPLREWLLNRARSFVFATAPPPSLAAAANEALRIVQGEPERRARLRSHGDRFRAGLSVRGIFLTPGASGHIIGIPLGDPRRTLEVARALESRGFLVGSIRPPSVPTGTSRLRVSMNAEHTPTQIDGLLSALGDLGIASSA